MGSTLKHLQASNTHTLTHSLTHSGTGETLHMSQQEKSSLWIQSPEETSRVWIHDSRLSVPVPYYTQLKKNTHTHTHTQTNTHTLTYHLTKQYGLQL